MTRTTDTSFAHLTLHISFHIAHLPVKKYILCMEEYLINT